MKNTRLFKGRVKAFAFFANSVSGYAARNALTSLMKERVDNVSCDVDASEVLMELGKITRVRRVEAAFWTAEIAIKAFYGTFRDQSSIVASRNSFLRELRVRIPPSQTFPVTAATNNSVRVAFVVEEFRELQYMTAIQTCGQQAMRLARQREVAGTQIVEGAPIGAAANQSLPLQ